jgi:oxygen-independent coproporphyrinogen-3 oxidase
MAGIYIHIPFCRQACHYCDFHFSTNLEKKEALVDAICRELLLQRDYLKDETITTIYFGGGTPSLLSEEEIIRLIQRIKDNFAVSLDAEVTLEANPDDLSLPILQAIRQCGVNRLSIGIQSFDQKILGYLNRVHDAAASIQCVVDARSAGFQNFSIDLIYAIPGQDNALWLQNIETAIRLKPTHISSYSLTIEEKTPFGRWSAQGKIKTVDDETAATQLEILVEQLDKAGYEQYEVSNFALPGYRSKHNSSYWQREKYLGVGPSAHSYNGISRQSNINNNHLYLKALLQDTIPAAIEILTPEDKINDYLMTTLRTSWGANLKLIKDEWKYDIIAVHGSYLNSLLKQKLASIESDVLILTKSGKLLADKISSDLFVIR